MNNLILPFAPVIGLLLGFGAVWLASRVLVYNIRQLRATPVSINNNQGASRLSSALITEVTLAPVWLFLYFVVEASLTQILIVYMLVSFAIAINRITRASR